MSIDLMMEGYQILIDAGLTCRERIKEYSKVVRNIEYRDQDILSLPIDEEVKTHYIQSQFLRHCRENYLHRADPKLANIVKAVEREDYRNI